MSKVIENYILKEAVGSGQYGKVFKSSHAVTGAVYAVKAIKSEKFKNVPKLQEFTNNEIATLTKLVNPNVIAFVEMLRTANNVYLIYEFCNGGTLEDVIKKKKFLQEKEALVVFSQIINAFRSLFNNNILHRDLKPSNILLHDGVIKVADFGFCKTLLSPSDLTQTMVGSPIYMAPEILKGCNYNIKADIWSMGVVLFEMLFGYCPFEDKTIARLIAQIDTKPLTIPRHINNISPKVEEILHRMLTVDPNKRIEWNALLSSPLFERPPLQDKTTLSANQTPLFNAPAIQQPQQLQQQQQQQLISPYILPNSQNSLNIPSAAIASLPQIQQPSQIDLYQQQQDQAQLLQQQKQNSSVQKLLELRIQIIYQIKTVSSLIEATTENDQQQQQYVTLGLILLKNASSQADYLRSQLNSSQQQFQTPSSSETTSKNTSVNNPDNQAMLNQVLAFVQREVSSLQTCLGSFKKEVELLLLSSMSFSGLNSTLKKEHDMIGIDFKNFKQTVLFFIDSILLNPSTTNNNTNNPSTPSLAQAQLANQILNCFLQEEYFSNSIEPVYNDLNNSAKVADLSSLLNIITHKTELAKLKIKPSDKWFIFY